MREDVQECFHTRVRCRVLRHEDNEVIAVDVLFFALVARSYQRGMWVGTSFIAETNLPMPSDDKETEKHGYLDVVHFERNAPFLPLWGVTQPGAERLNPSGVIHVKTTFCGGEESISSFPCLKHKAELMAHLVADHFDVEKPPAKPSYSADERAQASRLTKIALEIPFRRRH